jgi:uncharacterized protein (UPF0548 family)
MRTLKHPITVFTLMVLMVIGIGVGGTGRYDQPEGLRGQPGAGSQRPSVGISMSNGGRTSHGLCRDCLVPISTPVGAIPRLFVLERAKWVLGGHFAIRHGIGHGNKGPADATCCGLHEKGLPTGWIDRGQTRCQRLFGRHLRSTVFGHLHGDKDCVQRSCALDGSRRFQWVSEQRGELFELVPADWVGIHDAQGPPGASGSLRTGDNRRGNNAVKLVRSADSAAISQLVEALDRAEPTYEHTGAALTGELPVGFRHDHYTTVLGIGENTFHRAIEGLQTWQAHRLPFVRVVPSGAEIRSGATVIVLLGPSRLAIAAPCRILAVVNEPSRWGFAYGSLPGHPEQGEEAFVVSITEDGTVVFEVTAFSRPTDFLLRLSGPFGRALQQHGSLGYLRAVRRFVDRPVPDGT